MRIEATGPGTAVRAELSVWRDEQIAYRLRVDPRCLTVEAVRGGAMRPTVRHVDPCTCGMF